MKFVSQSHGFAHLFDKESGLFILFLIKNFNQKCIEINLKLKLQVYDKLLICSGMIFEAMP